MSNWTLWCLLAAPIVSLGCGGSKDTDTGPDTSTTDTSTTDTSTTDTSTTDTSTTGDQVRYNWFNPRGSDVPDAWAEGAFESSWPEVYGQTDAVSFYINGVGEDARGNMTLASSF